MGRREEEGKGGVEPVYTVEGAWSKPGSPRVHGQGRGQAGRETWGEGRIGALGGLLYVPGHWPGLSQGGHTLRGGLWGKAEEFGELTLPASKREGRSAEMGGGKPVLGRER